MSDRGYETQREGDDIESADKGQPAQNPIGRQQFCRLCSRINQPEAVTCRTCGTSLDDALPVYSPVI